MEWRNRVCIGDVFEYAKTLEPQSIQCLVTSPPYFGLRSYLAADHPRKGDELGSEATPGLFVAALVAVFRALRPALKDDGTLWVNLGDSYSSAPVGRFSGGGEAVKGRDLSGHLGKRSTVGPNLTNALERSMEGRPLVFRNALAIGIAPKGRKIALQDDGTPEGILLSLLGVERITIKQRNNHFCQVLHTLNMPGYCRITAPLCRAAVNDANLEIVLDAGQDISIVIAEHDADVDAELGVARVTSRASKQRDRTLPIEEPTEPIAESVGGSKPVGDTVALDPPLECFPQIYLVDQPVALLQRPNLCPSKRGHFRVTKATPQHLTLALGNTGVEIRAITVSHLYAPNSFGSLVRYSELYDNASRKANAQAPKQPLGIPWMVARALQEDGWFLRSDCIWHKPNPMPESVTDRPTRSHEYLFLLSKGPKYFYDAASIAETSATTFDGRAGLGTRPLTPGQEALQAQGIHGKTTSLSVYDRPTRNKRSVWMVSPAAFADAHFATFPPELIRPCIMAGTSSYGECSQCGRAWVRVVERTPEIAASHKGSTFDRGKTGVNGLGRVQEGERYERRATGDWQPQCACDAPTRPQTVCDPFVGSGTTPLVATQEGRNWTGCDLDERAVGWTATRLATVQRRIALPA